MEHLYNNKVIEEIRDILIARNKTVAVAESVTAGHLQAALSSALKAADFFQGGITVYNLGQKCRHLSVEPIAAAGCDCVSESVAKKMAVEVCKLFTCNYSIAITGYAAAMPEKGINDLYAYFAVAEDGEIVLLKKVTSTRERVEAQIDYTNQALKALKDILKNGN